MDKELMNREVLCILDTRQIQRYMFRSNTMLDTVGASDLMIHILDDAILHALRTVNPPVPEDQFDFSLDSEGEIPYFRSTSVQFQLITCQAGNAIFIVRTGALAQKIIRRVSRYYLEYGEIEIRIRTTAIECDLNQNEGRIVLIYSSGMNGEVQGNARYTCKWKS